MDQKIPRDEEESFELTQDEWKKKLTPEQYRIMRQGGTEAPGTGALLDEKRAGTYTCAACGNPLFASDAKFDSGTGWPSFDQALPDAVEFREDESHGMHRVEVLCGRCGGHLGHVFDDGPEETTGKRYCMNSVCLALEPKKE
jgi:peptide-methionine (R)-S-oxide reductase